MNEQLLMSLIDETRGLAARVADLNADVSAIRNDVSQLRRDLASTRKVVEGDTEGDRISTRMVLMERRVTDVEQTIRSARSGAWDLILHNAAGLLALIAIGGLVLLGKG